MVLIVVDSFCRILHDRNLNFRLVIKLSSFLYDAVHCFCLTRCILALSYLKNPLFVFKMPMIKESFWIKSFQKGGGGEMREKCSLESEDLCTFWIKLLKVHKHVFYTFQNKQHIKIIAISLLSLSVTGNLVSNHRKDPQQVTVFKSRLLQSSL